MLKLNFFKEFQTLAEVLAQLYPKETEIFRTKSHLDARYMRAELEIMWEETCGRVQRE